MIMRHMHTRQLTGAVAVFGIAALALTGCVGPNDADPEGPSGQGSPYQYEADWGTFTLSPDIAQKIEDGSAINVVLSMQGQTTPIYGPQYAYGLPLGIEAAEEEYGLDLSGQMIGPEAGGDNALQLSQIESLAAAGQIDCLALDGGGDPAFVRIIDRLMEDGIPVFTTGTDLVDSKRLGTFHTDWEFEGQLDAQATVDFFEAKGVDLTHVAMTSGAVDQLWAQTRMQAFEAELKKLVPGVTFVNTAESALMTGFSPTDVYAKVSAFLTGNPDVQVVYQTDTGAATVNKVITDLGREGETFSVSHNVSEAIIDGIAQGWQIATLSQDYPAQAGFAGRACGAFLATGEVLPNTNEPELIDSTNWEAALEAFKESTGQ
jgi:ABC-type sugar transport system substrate-binding protein